MSHHNYSLKTRLSGVLLATILLVSPIVASADVLDDMAAKLSEASASLNNILTSLSSLSGTQQAQVAGTSGALSLAVTSPNGGEVLSPGSTYNIAWSSSSVINMVSIGYSTGPGSLNWITNNIPNTNSYSWNVNVGNTTNTQFKIYIIGYQTGTGSVTDESDNFFTVTSGNNVNVTVPPVQSSNPGTVSGVVTPYLLDIDSITDTSISPRLEVNTNGNPDGRVRFDVSIINKENNSSTPFKTVFVFLPPVKQMYSASTTISGLVPATSYRLSTRTETDQWIVYPEFGSVTDFTTKSGPVVSPAPTPPTQTDLEIFKLCFGKYVVAGDSCAKADFDASGFINGADLALFKSALKYDMDSDSIIDLRDTTDNADLNFFKSCFGQYIASSTSCTKADFDNNGFVNGADLASFKSATKYDLNADSKVDLMDTMATTSTVASTNISTSQPPTTTPSPSNVIPTISLLATPAVTPYNGSVTLTWFSANATSCKADGGWSGNKGTMGSETINNLTLPLTTFFLTCTSEGGSKVMQVSVIATQVTQSESPQIPNITNPAVIQPPVIQPSFTQLPVFTERNLYRGMKGDGVRKLQELLAKDPQIYPSGEATGYYGFLTQAAVQNFQCKYSITCDGDPETTGYGVVGPKTMAKINEVAGSMSGGSTGSGGTTITPSTSGDTAKTVADYQKQISALLEQLKVLQAQLNSLPR